jgi:multidrug/hemolysin transport system ATP-binding protein
MSDIIVVNNLWKRYQGIEAVKGISFSVEEGSFFALLGENGAGKSTTINIIATLLKKTSGDVIINHYHLDKEDEAIRNDIGIVFQENMLDKHLTVRENIISRGLLYGKSKKEIVGHMLELSEKIGIIDILDRRYGTLSGGQKRRADIVRALINNPRLLILDEPTTGLDPYARKCVWEVIKQLKEERKLTIFLTTHYMEEAVCADSIVIMDKGEIKAFGSPKQLRSEYSTDRLILGFHDLSSAQKRMDQFGCVYRKEKECFVIHVKNSIAALDIINQLRDEIESFEVIKGNMDDVFLNITSPCQMEGETD